MRINYGLTDLQMKVIKDVEKSMNRAAAQGVHFWDNYGTLTAYNNSVINCPVPDSSLTPLNEDHVYGLMVGNFHPGNADDPLYVSFK